MWNTRCPKTVRADRRRPVVLGKYETRVIDMASAYATLADSASTTRRTSWRRSSTRRARCSSTPVPRRTPGAPHQADVADNVSAAMAPIPGYSTTTLWRVGGPPRPRPAPTNSGHRQNRDAWMVGCTPQCPRRWGGHRQGDVPLVNSWGGSVYPGQACLPTSGRPPWTAPWRHRLRVPSRTG